MEERLQLWDISLCLGERRRRVALDQLKRTLEEIDVAEEVADRFALRHGFVVEIGDGFGARGRKAREMFVDVVGRRKEKLVGVDMKKPAQPALACEMRRILRVEKLARHHFLLGGAPEPPVAGKVLPDRPQPRVTWNGGDAAHRACAWEIGIVGIVEEKEEMREADGAMIGDERVENGARVAQGGDDRGCVGRGVRDVALNPLRRNATPGVGASLSGEIRQECNEVRR